MGALATFPLERTIPPDIGSPCVLPKSEEMERAVLGGCLLNPDQIVALGLEVEDFAGDQHQSIWRAILTLVGDGQPVDLRTVQAKLEEQGTFDTIGGLAYLAGLDLDLPDLGRVGDYAGQLRRLRQRRDLMTAMAAAYQALPSGAEEDRQERVEAVAEALTNLGSRGIELVKVGDVVPERVSFVWDQRIPRRKLTLLEGDPGQGKSYITAAIATAGSLGKGLPGSGEFEPWRTLLCTAEDAVADTLRPRLDQMGANVDLIYAYERAIDLSTPEGRADLSLAIARVRPVLVTIDPLVAFVGGRTNTFRANDVRAILEPVAAMAEKYDCAILAVRHLNKAQTGRTMYRGQGSIDFTAAARSVLLAGTDGESDQRALVHIKCNVAGLATSLAYEIGDDGQFAWAGECKLTADDLLGAESSDSRSALEEAEELLLDVLKTGPVRAADVLDAAREVGIGEKSLKKAKRKLEVESEKRGFGRDSTWYWILKGVPKKAKGVPQ